MRAIRLLLLLLLPAIVSPARATDEAEDWKLVGGMLSLMQQFVHLAAHSPDPKALDKSMDAMLSGENAQANRLASGLMEEILQDVPLEQRSAFVSIGRDMLVLARRERSRAGAETLPERSVQVEPLQARKDLHAMGLKYWDEQQFLEAVRRGDRIAVELFVAARGLEARNPPPAR